MTKLLVSVRSRAEALDAIAGGAHVIDVKEPANGALGAASPEVWRQVADAVGSSRGCQLSLATGELLEQQPGVLTGLLQRLLPVDATEETAPGKNTTGNIIVKTGLAGCQQTSWRPQVASWVEALPAGAQPALAAYADYSSAQSPPPTEVLQAAAALSLPFVLLDTFDKSAGDLLSAMPLAALSGFMQQAQQAGIAIALAGSLPREIPAELLALQPAYIAVRGAVCEGGRQSRVCQKYVSQMAAILAV